MISEVVTLQMNEEVAGQLHSGTISMLDKQHACILELEETVEGLTVMNLQLKKNMEQVHMQSVMCHALLMHYVESHWELIGQLLSQIGALSSCGLTPPFGHCSCNVINEPFNSPSSCLNHLPLQPLSPSTTLPPSYHQ